MDNADIDDVSFDIIKCLPEDICDNIFGNLEIPDLLEASLVSTEWYKYIAKTAVCMQKLKLKFSFKSMQQMTPTMKGILVNSSRKYENVELMHYSSKVDDMRDVLKVAGRKWKKVTMTRLNFPLVSDFINFISIVEPFVEELKMDRVYIDYIYNDQPKKMLSFPKLKFLEAKYIQTLIYYEALANISTLKEFNIVSGGQSTLSMNAIQKMFRNNKELKKQSIVTHAFNQYFDEDISSDITYRLTSLQVRDLYDLSDVLKTNFKQFLELHMNTLERLSIADWMGHELVKMIFHMPKLKHLLLKGFHCVEDTVDWKESSFKQSLSLTSLDLFDIRLKVEILRAFLTATPNVKKLTLYSINDESITCISELLPNLESLSVDMFEILDVTDKTYLPNLKEFTMKVHKQEIKQSQADDDRGNFERLFIKKMKEIAPKESVKPRVPKRHHFLVAGCLPHIQLFSDEDSEG